MTYPEKKRLDFIRAVARLDEVLGLPYSDVIRDAAIQRFEFCYELCWKVLRQELQAMGHAEIDSPRNVFKKAFLTGLIEGEETWLAMLNARNLSVHTYDEATAKAIFDQLPQFLEKFKALAE